MSATKLDATIRGVGREIFTAAEAPAAETELQRTLTAGAATAATPSLGATSTPKVDKPPLVLTVTIAGTQTIDLTSVAGSVMPPSATRTLDYSAAKNVATFLRAPTTNAAAINVAPGAANPYPLFGTGNDINVEPGETVGKVFSGIATNKPAVSGTVKTIDVSGTNGDKLYVELYFGT